MTVSKVHIWFQVEVNAFQTGEVMSRSAWNESWLCPFKMDTFGIGTKRCPSYKESNKKSKERQGPTLGVCFTEESIL